MKRNGGFVRVSGVCWHIEKVFSIILPHSYSEVKRSELLHSVYLG